MEILGIDFFEGDIDGVLRTVKNGGLLLVPAAPALITIREDSDYYQSLKFADVVIPDSGYMVLIWNLTHRKKLRRISGLEFIIAFLANKEVQSGQGLFLIDPSTKEAQSNQQFLNRSGFEIEESDSYIAPMYDKSSVEDPALLKVLERSKPKYIIINLGGGVQEKLGYYLKKNLSYRPAIICTGAAIAFLTGEQVNIPNWADRFFVGWLFRCISRPKLYVPRYLKAFKLIRMMLGDRKSMNI